MAFTGYVRVVAGFGVVSASAEGVLKLLPSASEEEYDAQT
jgi:hypothetical protein